MLHTWSDGQKWFEDGKNIRIVTKSKNLRVWCLFKHCVDNQNWIVSMFFRGSPRTRITLDRGSQQYSTQQSPRHEENLETFCDALGEFHSFTLQDVTLGKNWHALENPNWWWKWIFIALYWCQIQRNLLNISNSKNFWWWFPIDFMSHSGEDTSDVDSLQKPVHSPVL